LGIDGNKKIHGRKHQLAVDAQGMLIDVHAHAANENDSKASLPLIERLKKRFPTLVYAHVDNGYVGDATAKLEKEGMAVTVPPKKGKGFAAQPVRWRVERSIAWLKNWRRLCADYERTTASSEAFVWLAGIGQMLSRQPHAHRLEKPGRVNY
jgi:putative transposase